MSFFKIFLGISLFFVSSSFAEFYLKGYGGVLFGTVHLEQIKTEDIYQHEGLKGTFDYDSKSKEIETQFIGGVRFGSWFCRDTAPGCKKHFGCYFDTSFDVIREKMRHVKTPVSYTEETLGPAVGVTDTRFSSKGFSVTPAMLFAMRCGFCAKPEHTFGVVQPYFAIGPGLWIVRQKAALLISPHQADDSNLAVDVFTDQTIHMKGKTALALALVLDAGVQWMVCKNFSFDTFFRYRFAKPYFHRKNELSFHPTFHLLSVQLGVGHHF